MPRGTRGIGILGAMSPNRPAAASRRGSGRRAAPASAARRSCWAEARRAVLDAAAESCTRVLDALEQPTPPRGLIY